MIYEWSYCDYLSAGDYNLTSGYENYENYENYQNFDEEEGVHRNRVRFRFHPSDPFECIRRENGHQIETIDKNSHVSLKCEEGCLTIIKVTSIN